MATLNANTLKNMIALADLYDSGKVCGRQETKAIGLMLGTERVGVTAPAKALGFLLINDRKSDALVGEEGRPGGRMYVDGVRVRTSAAIDPPNAWPPLFEAQRKLHKAGVPLNIVAAASDIACGDAEILMDAAGTVAQNGGCLDNPSVLYDAIRGVIAEKWRELRECKENSITVEELASHLRETPAIGKRGLLNRVEAFLHIQRRERGLPKIERRKANA